MMNLKIKTFGQLTTRELYEILRSRSEVFIVEMGIRVQDMDCDDYRSLHCFFEEDGRVVAYLRAYHMGEDSGAVKLGRVLALDQGKGIGRQLVERSLPEIWNRMGCEKFYLHAQKNAQGFYEKLGFQVVSDEFTEAGIPHVAMELKMEY